MLLLWSIADLPECRCHIEEEQISQMLANLGMLFKENSALFWPT